jgi:transposase
MVDSKVRAYKDVAVKARLRFAFQCWHRACNYLKDGKLEIDNNWIENKIRPLALGRTDYLFASSHEAAARSGRMEALFAMCKKEEIHPSQWLSDVLARIQDHPINPMHQLLPFNWKQEKEARVQNQPS